MFEVIGADIMALDDTALRELVGRLCKSELERDGLATSGVHYGGDQNAPDDGVDVEVEISTHLRENSYIPSLHTWFQVKKYKFPPSAISKEMRPNGDLRPTFERLASVNGSYIIVSGSDSLSYKARRDRIDAMRLALGEYSEAIQIDFYDRDRLANWANCYAPIVAWVKSMIGRGLDGWKPYCNWANPSFQKFQPYLLDKNVRFQKSQQTKLLTAEEALTDMRSALHVAGTSVRLIGLSGVGKTRFAQALFENNVGKNPLSPEVALYLDQQRLASCSPIEMMEDLVYSKRRTVMIIDNCSAAEHRQLTTSCKSAHSAVSLLTIEYDVQDDEPEDSEVYQMFPSSDECIIHILEQQTPKRNREDYQRIALLAGGNARVAIVLAKAIETTQDLNALGDKELFERIFWQKGIKDDALYRTAEVCSLVYSFSINSTTEKIDELEVLGAICGLPRKELYRNINRLAQKQLIQKRSDWRAVLPHALANRLAKDALEDFDFHSILITLNQGSPHMLRSFSKRLSFLHDSESAQKIFSFWLESSPMTTASKWNNVCQYRLEDAAPVIPDKVLSFIESIYLQCGEDFLYEAFDARVIEKLLLQFAYEAKWFDRSVELLTKLNPSRVDMDSVDTLFQIAYSGTYAPLEQRLSLIHRMLQNADIAHKRLGIEFLQAMLRCSINLQFPQNSLYSFGMHQRNSGWRPLNRQQCIAWYIAVIRFIADELQNMSFHLQEQLRKFVGESLRGLWMDKCFDVVEFCCRQLGSQKDWWHGWVGLGQIKRFDAERLDPLEREHLNQLIAFVEPVQPVPRMACLLQAGSLLLDSYFPAANNLLCSEELEKECRYLAVQFAERPDLLEELLSKLDDGYEVTRPIFGQALAEAEHSSSFAPSWAILCKTMGQDLSIATAYLRKKYNQDRGKTLELLNHLEGTKAAAKAVRLHTFLECSAGYLQHILELLANGTIDLDCVSSLCYTITDGVVKEPDLLNFLLEISKTEGGVPVAVAFLAQYSYQFHNRQDILSMHCKEVGRCLLLDYLRTRNSEQKCSLEYEFTMLATACFGEDTPSEQIEVFFRLLKQCPSVWSTRGDSIIHGLILPFSKQYVEQFLDVFVGEKQTDDNLDLKLSGYHGMSINVIDHLDPDRVLSWASSSAKRLRIAKLSNGFSKGEDKLYHWGALSQKLLGQHRTMT